MTRKGITTKQRYLIRSYVRRGFSANRIQRKLRERHVGLRRTVLLKYVRESKRQKPKAQVSQYVPQKYRRGFPSGFGGKGVKLEGKWKGEKKVIRKTGGGRDLYNFVRQEISKAKEGKEWDRRPEVISQ